MLTKKIEEIDRNFVVKHDDNKFTYFNVAYEMNFEISGFQWVKTNKSFCRLEECSLHKFNQGIKHLAYCTSGGVIRFVSDSEEIAVK